CESQEEPGYVAPALLPVLAAVKRDASAQARVPPPRQARRLSGTSLPVPHNLTPRSFIVFPHWAHSTHSEKNVHRKLIELFVRQPFLENCVLVENMRQQSRCTRL